MDFLKIRKEYNSALQELKESVIRFINSIDVDGPAKNGACFSVSLATIQQNRMILSPFYYDIDAQKAALIQMVNGKSDLGFMAKFKEIAEKGSLKISGKNPYVQPFHPGVVNALKEFTKEW